MASLFIVEASIAIRRQHQTIVELFWMVAVSEGVEGETVALPLVEPGGLEEAKQNRGKGF